MQNTLFNAWFLLTASDAIGAILAVLLLLRMKDRFASFLAIILIGVAVESTVASFSLVLMFPQEAQIAPYFALVRIAGRTVKSAGVWALNGYLLRLWGGD